MQDKISSLPQHNRRTAVAVFLVLTMLSGTFASASDVSIATEMLPEPSEESTGEMFFHPGPNETSINASFPSLISVPSNQSFLGGTVGVEPQWNVSQSNGTQFGVESLNRWNGTHSGTNGIGHGGKLTLATNSSLGTINDFESSVVVAPGWMGTGSDHEVWSIQRPSIIPFTSYSNMVLPDNGTQSLGFLSTQALGDLGPSMNGCLRSPQIEPPVFITNYSLSFQSWSALFSDDAAWVEIRHSNGTWGLLSPEGGYDASANLSLSPSTVWNGESDAWSMMNFSLDSLVTDLQEFFQFRVCYQTSATQGLRGGWFIDDVLLQNQGDAPGAWFHGNLSGDYQPDAYGDVVLPVNFSGLTGQNVELEVWVNWDIQGGAFDYMTAWLSLDNGSTYNPISNHPGHPSRGATCNAGWFNGGDSQLEWCPISYRLPWNTTAPPNASSALVRFNVQTDAQVNFGGTTSSGWEGIMLDDLSVWTDRGTALQTFHRVNSFSNQPNGTVGSADGWLENSTFVNEWQWTNQAGHNLLQSTSYGFESGNELPAGWSLWAQSNRRWEVGTTSNSSGFGPGAWHSGINGAGIYLEDEYRNNMWTDLYTPEYYIPVNSTSRLTFRSWMCTEPNWDGGTVSISTDGGESWWFIPPTLGSFHDQISTANSNSPFFNQGIIDGSNVVGGCHNVNRGFDLKQYDVSNLTGSSVRAKFSFFSDQLVELDGWYLDDAGIEIDVYEPSGTWTSMPLYPDSVFGWGQLDGLVDEPENTSVRFDVLDANGTVIEGFSNRTLPIDLPFDPHIHTSLSVRVLLDSSQNLLTPSIKHLSIGTLSFVDAYHLKHALAVNGVNVDKLSVDSSLSLVSSSSNPLVTWQFETFTACPFQRAVFQTIGDNLSASHGSYSVVSTRWTDTYDPTLSRTIERQGRPLLSTDFSLTWMPGDSLRGFVFEPLCATAPVEPRVMLGTDSTSVFSWPSQYTSSEFGLNRYFYHPNGPHSEIEISNSGPTTYHEISVVIARDVFHSGPSSFEMSALVKATTDGNSASIVQSSKVTELTFAAQQFPSFDRLDISGSCDSQNPLALYVDVCVIELELVGNVTLNFSSLQFIPVQQTLSTELTGAQLNAILNSSRVSSASAMVELPMQVRTSSGSVMVNLSYRHQAQLVDYIETPSYNQWLPDQLQTFQTQHWRGDANDLLWDGPDISSATFALSETRYYNDRFVEIEVYNLQNNPQFRQLSGKGLASLDEALSSATCSTNVCTVNWTLESHWLMDDVDDLHLLSMAVDEDGFSTGPVDFYRQTVFNEIENDLEIVDFTLVDHTNRNLDDWSNPMWPFHLNASQAMTASGKVRFEGILNAWVGTNQSNVRIDATAVPPVNVSGGPDEWPEQSVEWSRSWYAEVDASGAFSLPLETPSLSDDVPSHTRIAVSAHLHRTGPVGENTTTSVDMTSSSQSVPYVYDKVPPSTVTLLALDSGGYTQADGHVWTAQQDVALRLILRDPEGLSNSVQLHSWLEARDDANGDGVMDSDEYSSQTVTFNNGLKYVEIDLPLLSWQAILPNGLSSGRLSVVVEGNDLAGNPLSGGGDFGDEQDLATLEVQQRFDTFIETDSLFFDRFNSTLLAGHNHSFSFILTDGNGLSTLDRIELALLSRDRADTCFIEYSPRFGNLSYDESCFQSIPILVHEKIPLQQKWNLTFHFRISWDAPNLSSLGGTPSLRVFDEGQDLGLGLSKISVFDWTLATALEVRSVEISDLTSPVGTITDDSMWIHSNDTLLIETALYHLDSPFTANYLPDSAHVRVFLSDGERSSISNTTVAQNGSITVELLLDKTILKHRLGTLELSLEGLEFGTFEKSYTLHFDNDAPILSVPPGVLSHLDSTELSEQDIIIVITDQAGVNRTSVRVHWHFDRAGTIVENSQGSSSLAFLSGEGTTFTFNSLVDFAPAIANTINKNDQPVVWFSAFDNSGRSLTGVGTVNDPLRPQFRWVAFEPTIDNIIVTPYRPTIGEELSIFVRVANIGVLPGNMTVECYDDEGRVIGSNASLIEGGEWVDYTWKVEAWKTGRLGLTVKILNHTQNIPVILADVEAYDEKSGQMVTSVGFASLIFMLSLGIFGVAMLRRKERMNQFTLDQVARAVNQRSQPPPRPKELVELFEEE